VSVPTYTVTPTCATATYTYAIATSPSTSIVTLSGTSINVSSSSGSDAGTYTVTVTTSVTGTTISKTASFTLTVTADPTLTFSPISNVVYTLGATSVTRAISYTLNPAGSPNAVTLSVTMNDGSALVAPITRSGTTITVNQSTWFTPGVYTVKVSATLAGATT